MIIIIKTMMKEVANIIGTILGSIIRYLLSFIAGSLLRLAGWHPPSKECIDNLSKRGLIVFSHSTQMDYFILLAYILWDDGFRSISHRFRIMMRSDFFDIPIVGFIIKYFGGVQATPRSLRNGGGTTSVINNLNNENGGYTFLISPKGTIIKAEWRTGWYHIARGTESGIGVGGVDYYRKEPVVLKYYNWKDIKDIDYNDLQDMIKDDMKLISPLYPDDEIHPDDIDVDSLSITTSEFNTFIRITIILLCRSILLCYSNLSILYDMIITTCCIVPIILYIEYIINSIF